MSKTAILRTDSLLEANKIVRSMSIEGFPAEKILIEPFRGKWTVFVPRTYSKFAKATLSRSMRNPKGKVIRNFPSGGWIQVAGPPGRTMDEIVRGLTFGLKQGTWQVVEEGDLLILRRPAKAGGDVILARRKGEAEVRKEEKMKELARRARALGAIECPIHKKVVCPPDTPGGPYRYWDDSTEYHYPIPEQ